MSEIMKNKILRGEFTPPITNSWTKWKSFIVIDDVTKKFRSNWDAAFWLLNKNDVEYEKLRKKSMLIIKKKTRKISSAKALY
jgi:hypothetical protein